MEEIIKKAVEGGWDKDNARVYDCDGHDSQHIDELMLMDKTFWQSLGKACGSENPYGLYKWCDMVDKDGKIHEIGWKRNALKFHEKNLTEGWDKACEFLNGLIK